MSSENMTMAEMNEPATAPARPRKRMKTMGGGNLLLTALFFSGIAFVYLLSLHGGPQKASAQQQMAETQVDELLSRFEMKGLGKGRSANSVVESFYCEARQRQIPLDRLQANPFVYRPAPAVLSPIPTTELHSPVEDRQALRLTSEMIDTARRLTLQSVLMGSRGNTAMISNNLLAEGQTIRGWTIGRINPNEVELVWKDQKYVLKMR